MAKDKVTSNGGNNQEATGKQESPHFINDNFYQINDTAKTLAFLIEISTMGSDSVPSWPYVAAVRELLTQELRHLNEVMEDLAERYEDLTYVPVKGPTSPRHRADIR
jgi:hypothetical protein